VPARASEFLALVEPDLCLVVPRAIAVSVITFTGTEDARVRRMNTTRFVVAMLAVGSLLGCT
jgi:hypothetical protein